MVLNYAIMRLVVKSGTDVCMYVCMCTGEGEFVLQADAGIVVRVRGEAMHETQVWNRVDSWKPKRRDGCVV